MARLTKKQKLQMEVLRKLIPLAPYLDFHTVYEAMRAHHMNNLEIPAAAHLAAIAHIRHQHTEYDDLRNEGYDHDSARHFVLNAINEVLQDWGSSHQLSEDGV